MARLYSDYDPDTFLMITQSVDGDACLKIFGKGEMRITLSGSRLKGQDLLDAIDAIRTLERIAKKQG